MTTETLRRSRGRSGLATKGHEDPPITPAPHARARHRDLPGRRPLVFVGEMGAARPEGARGAVRAGYAPGCACEAHPPAAAGSQSRAQSAPLSSLVSLNLSLQPACLCLGVCVRLSPSLPAPPGVYLRVSACPSLPLRSPAFPAPSPVGLGEARPRPGVRSCGVRAGACGSTSRRSPAGTGACGCGSGPERQAAPLPTTGAGPGEGERVEAEREVIVINECHH